MRKIMTAALLAFGMLQAAQAADAVHVQRPVPFNEDADVPGAVKRECKLDEQLSDFVAQYAREKGMTVDFAPQVTATSPGQSLVMEITDVVSEGNAFLGHHKSVTVKGKLYRDGKLAGSFKGRRNSMGGAFGGFKGSCSVLGRSVKALGEDIAGWLAAPREDALLGDLE
ncbi:hypothetical protein ACFWZ3_06970 [Frateuria sp. GZRR35]|uniref:hypothetical protein n=1 Tax=Frateuria sp. GZRR35 TaxID=3351536 RepID=UPI003EDB86DF